MRIRGRKTRAVNSLVLLVSFAVSGWSAIEARASDRFVRCDEIDFVDPADWTAHYDQAMRDIAGSMVTIAGHDFQAVGSICDYNAEKGLPSSFQWEYLHFADVAWSVFARSELGDADLFFLKTDREPIYFGVPKDVLFVALIDKSDGGLVHVDGLGSMTVAPDGTVTAKVGKLEFLAGSLPEAGEDGVSVLIRPQAGHIGASEVRMDGDNILLNGWIGLQTYAQLRDIQALSSEPKTVVFEKVDGTFSYSATAYTGRLIRDSGWSTYARHDSEVFSGGVDLFLSGRRRIVERGADFGVHPGCCYAGREGGELPDDHRYHRQLVDYSNEMLGTPAGADFHRFTDQVVPHDKFRLMADEDLLQWGVATEIVEPADRSR
jgi:hypothetical protein